jgi:hypothetical protein
MYLFTVEVVTNTGLVGYFVRFVIDLKSTSANGRCAAI